MGRGGFGMKSMSAKDAKNGFGLLLDTARAEPVTIEKHGRAVVVVMAFEEYERLRTAAKAGRAAQHHMIGKK
jgi:prevent-host-death family protein